jgi:hypothetical protein
MWFDLLTFAVPMNVGSLEGTRIVALKALGFTSLMGMTYGIALRLAQIFWAGVGLVSYALMTSTRTPSVQRQPSVTDPEIARSNGEHSEIGAQRGRSAAWPANDREVRPPQTKNPADPHV